MERVWIAIAGISGAAAVGADAAARHLLAGDAFGLDLVVAGARYGLAHAIALLGTAALMGGWGRMPASDVARRWLIVAGWCFAAGLLLFPGGLYLLAAGAPAFVARLTPIGGLAFIAGWVALVFAALAPRRD